jgi:RNA polymerase primary sigma factor
MDDSLRKLFKKWKAQGYAEYLEFKEALSPDIVEQEQVDDIIEMINEMGIEVRMVKSQLIDLDSENNNN